MASALDGPAALDYEDSAVRIAGGTEADARGLVRKFVKKTYTLTDGPHSGDTVTYWAEEVNATSGTGTTVDTEMPAAAALSDANANPTTPMVGAAGLTFDGTDWGRLKEPTGDDLTVTGIPSAGLVGFDGTTWDRLRSGSAANLSAATQSAAAMATRPGDWTVSSSPAAGSAASAVKAAGAAGVRHVCTAVSARLAVATAITAATFTVNLRDGATGAGTVLMSWRARAVTADTNHVLVELSGLNIVGSAATAMTLEFTAAGEATTLQDCNISGYSVA